MFSWKPCFPMAKTGPAPFDRDPRLVRGKFNNGAGVSTPLLQITALANNLSLPCPTVLSPQDLPDGKPLEMLFLRQRAGHLRTVPQGLTGWQTTWNAYSFDNERDIFVRCLKHYPLIW